MPSLPWRITGGSAILLLGAGPSAAAHPNAHRCALGAPGPPRVPLTRRLGRGPQPAPAQPTHHGRPRRVACRGRAAAIANAPTARGISRPFRARFAPRANGAAPATGPGAARRSPAAPSATRPRHCGTAAPPSQPPRPTTPATVHSVPSVVRPAFPLGKRRGPRDAQQCEAPRKAEPMGWPRSPEHACIPASAIACAWIFA
jgi:hypothetical protein